MAGRAAGEPDAQGAGGGGPAGADPAAPRPCRGPLRPRRAPGAPARPGPLPLGPRRHRRGHLPSDPHRPHPPQSWPVPAAGGDRGLPRRGEQLRGHRLGADPRPVRHAAAPGAFPGDPPAPGDRAPARQRPRGGAGRAGGPAAEALSALPRHPRRAAARPGPPRRSPPRRRSGPGPDRQSGPAGTPDRAAQLVIRPCPRCMTNCDEPYEVSTYMLFDQGRIRARASPSAPNAISPIAPNTPPSSGSGNWPAAETTRYRVGTAALRTPWPITAGQTLPVLSRSQPSTAPTATQNRVNGSTAQGPRPG